MTSSAASSVFTPGTRVRVIRSGDPTGWVGYTGTILRRYNRNAGGWDWVVEMDGEIRTSVAFYGRELEPLS
jgi:hypothetical protein